IARAADSSTQMTRLGSVIGTPHYMSPEQAEGKELDGRSDIYSLGVLFYKMLTGDVPYKADSAVAIGIRHITDPLPELTGDLAMFQPCLDRFLAKRPEERYQTGLEVMEAIEVLERSETLPAGPVKTEIINTAEIEAVRRSAERSAHSLDSRNTPSSNTAQSRTAPLAWVAAGIFLALVASSGAYIALQGAPQWLADLARPYVPQLFEEPSTPETAGAIEASPAAGHGPETPADTGLPSSPVEAVATAPGQGVGASPQTPRDLVSLLANARELSVDPVRNADALGTVYREILALDPASGEATNGLISLADALLAAAHEAVDQGGLEEGQRLVGLGLSIFPDDARFSSLASDANAQLGVQRLLQQASKMPRPAAVQAYRQVLSRSPDNIEAQRGLETVAASYASEALDAVNAGNLAGAEAILEDAAALALVHSELANVSEAVAAARERAARIVRLMSEGSGLLTRAGERGAGDREAGKQCPRARGPRHGESAPRGGEPLSAQSTAGGGVAARRRCSAGASHPDRGAVRYRSEQNGARASQSARRRQRELLPDFGAGDGSESSRSEGSARGGRESSRRDRQGGS
ncbi:MAG: hypothetical protein P8Y95_04330, partial [Gammaproteobacteria bacterium]